MKNTEGSSDLPPLRRLAVSFHESGTPSRAGPVHPLAHTTRDPGPTPVTAHGGRRHTGPTPSGVSPGESPSETLLE